MNTTRYDTAFYVQALDRFVATGECAETDTEPLYAYLLSVMNDSMVKVQVLGNESVHQFLLRHHDSVYPLEFGEGEVQPPEKPVGTE